MSNKTTVFAVLAGIGAGAALGYWFASEKNDKLRKKISKALDNLNLINLDDLVQKRYDKFRKMGNQFIDF